MDEVDVRIVEISKELHKKVINMPQSVEQQKKFVKALIHLSAISSNVSTVISFQEKIIHSMTLNAGNQFLGTTNEN